MMRRLRPSAAHQWMACGLAAYAPLDRPEEDGEAAQEGTCAAWVAECIVNGDATSAEDMLGETHANGWEVDEEMVKFIDQYLAILPPTGRAEVFMQTENLEGTADHVGYDNTLVITDLKYGYRIVEAVGNWQLLCYLWLHLYTLSPDQWPSEVELRIYQPRAIHEHGPLRSWQLTRDEYGPLMDRITSRIVEIITGDQTARSGEHCRHCMHAVGCQALTQSVYALTDFARESRAYAQPDAQQLADELHVLRRAKALLDARSNAVEEEIEYRMKNGAYVPGWVRKPRYGKKRFMYDAATIEMLTGVNARNDKLCTPAELLRRGADPKIVKSVTETPMIGAVIEPFEGEEKVAQQFRSVGIK